MKQLTQNGKKTIKPQILSHVSMENKMFPEYGVTLIFSVPHKAAHLLARTKDGRCQFWRSCRKDFERREGIQLSLWLSQISKLELSTLRLEDKDNEKWDSYTLSSSSDPSLLLPTGSQHKI